MPCILVRVPALSLLKQKEIKPIKMYEASETSGPQTFAERLMNKCKTPPTRFGIYLISK